MRKKLTKEEKAKCFGIKESITHGYHKEPKKVIYEVSKVQEDLDTVKSIDLTVNKLVNYNKEEAKVLKDTVTTLLNEINYREEETKILKDTLSTLLDEVKNRREETKMLKENLEVLIEEIRELNVVQKNTNSIVDKILNEKNFSIRTSVDVPESNIKAISAMEKVGKGQEELLTVLNSIRKDLIVMGNNQIAFHTKREVEQVSSGTKQSWWRKFNV